MNNYNRKANVSYLRQEYFELLDGSIPEMLILDRLLFRLYKKYGLTILQEELDGTEKEEYHGWMEIDFDKMGETLVLKFSEKTIRRAVEHLEELGFLLVLRSEGWKKANKYRPNVKGIKDALDKLGWPLVIDRSSITEDDIDTGAESAANNPPPTPEAPKESTISQEKAWGDIPGANLTTTQEQKDEVARGQDWAKQYRALNNAPEHLKHASFIFSQMTGFEPTGKGWIAGMHKLWAACESSQEFFILVLQRGMEMKYDRPELMFSGPQSFVFIATNLKAMKKSSVINQKRQQALSQTQQTQQGPKQTSIPVVGQQVATNRRYILKPLQPTPEQAQVSA